MKQAPWILGGAVIFGTAFGTLPFSIALPGFVFLGAGVAVLLLFTIPKIEQNFLLLGFSLSLIVFWFAQERLYSFNILAPVFAEQKTYRVAALPEEKGFYQAVYLTPAQCIRFLCEEKAVLWQAPLSEEFGPGERIVISCGLSLPENFTEDFDYRRYLAKEGIGYMCKEDAMYQKLEPDYQTFLYEAFFAVKKKGEEVIGKSLPEPEAGLAKGLLLGGSNYLSTMTEEQFIKLGLTHIVAVSGYNIILIVNALLFLALGIGFWRKGATGFAFLGIMSFILLIGAPASAVRAGFMAFAAFGGFLVGRVTYSLQALLVAAAIMVLWNPLVLWYDAGFQLSFLATIAVIISMRSVEEKLSSHALVRALQEIVWLSVWVYLFLLPLILLQFKTLTILSIPANILFLPVVPLAMLTSFGVAALSFIFPPLTVVVSWLAYIPLTYILRGTYFLGSIPGTTLPVSLPVTGVALWYIFLLFVIVTREEKRKRKSYEKNFSCPISTHQH